MKLNLGCGQNKIPGCVNVDIEGSCKPDVFADFRHNLPYGDDSVDTVYLFHVIEHIEEPYHPNVLFEIWRVLKPDGELFISYPEFRKVAQNYIDNYKGQRDFWKHTIYGRQIYKSDYHVALMDTMYFVALLRDMGFTEIEVSPEPVPNEFNTVVKCKKGKMPDSYETLVNADIFGAKRGR